MTKIKDAFAIFKNLVLESRAKANFATNDKLPDGGTQVATDTLKQVKDLKSLLLQRDNEITILVSMVKKGTTLDDVRSSSGNSHNRSGSSRNYSIHGSNPLDDQASEDGMSTSRSHQSSRTVAGNGYAAASAHIDTRQQQQQSEMFVKEEAAAKARREQERILKRNLFGVPPPTDKAVFDDAAG